MLRRYTLLLWLFMAATALMGNAQTGVSRQGKAIPKIILDTDIGSSTDDLFAMQLLYRYADEGQCHLLGVVVDRMGDSCIALADAMNTYYGFENLPIGVERNGIAHPNVYINYAKMARTPIENGCDMFPHTYSRYDTLPDGWKLYRRLLADAEDHSISIIAIGFVTTIAQLLESGPDSYSPLSGQELVRKKVKCIYFMGTKLGESDSPGYNLKSGLDAAHRFLDQWPREVDIVLSPSPAGDTIEYCPDSVVADIWWTDRHPIKQVYTQNNCNTGQRMWDALPVINAVEGNSLFGLSGRGWVTINENNRIEFSPDSNGNCRYQTVGDRETNRRLLEIIRQSN